jgi:hypothetical protein
MNRTILATVLATAASAVGAAPALAADTASVNISASLPQTCAFTTVPAAVVTIQPVAGEYNIGDLGYTCNFVGQVQLVLELPDGSRLRNTENGGDVVDYGLAWTLPPNSPTPSYQTFAPGNVPFSWPTNTVGTPNVENKGALWVNLPSNLTVAGTYSSVITYTISP